MGPLREGQELLLTCQANGGKSFLHSMLRVIVKPVPMMMNFMGMWRLERLDDRL